MSAPHRYLFAIEPAALEHLQAELAAYSLADVRPPAAAAGPAPGRRPSAQTFSVDQGVAIIPVQGILMSRPGIIERILGATPTEDIESDLRSAAADQQVKAILLDVNSPGGGVAGTQELARLIAAVNAQKPVVALASGAMLSAAYWIGSAADSLYASGDTSMIGSIGVVATHVDISERDRQMGLKRTPIVAGRYKAIASEYAPLTKEGAASLQAQVDYLYSIFINDVASARGASPKAVAEQMADGRIFFGSQAVQAGLIDGLASIDQLVSQLSGGTMPRMRPNRSVGGGGSAANAAAVGGCFESRCKALWDRDLALRAEFTDFNGYFEYASAAQGEE
jgi:signal peptide peptidase SppA